MIKKVKSLLIINEGNSDNIGDQAINQSLKYLVNNELEYNYFFEDLSRNKKLNDIFNSINYSKSQASFKSPSFLKSWIYRFIWVFKNFSRINKACNKNDYAIIGGGQLLLANNIFPFELFVWTFFLKVYKVNYSFFSVGTQGNFSKSDKFFLKFSLSGANKIFVRDRLSRDLIKSNFNIESILTYDVAFNYNKIITKNINNNKSRCYRIECFMLIPCLVKHGVIEAARVLSKYEFENSIVYVGLSRLNFY